MYAVGLGMGGGGDIRKMVSFNSRRGCGKCYDDGINISRIIGSGCWHRSHYFILLVYRISDLKLKPNSLFEFEISFDRINWIRNSVYTLDT